MHAVLLVSTFSIKKRKSPILLHETPPEIVSIQCRTAAKEMIVAIYNEPRPILFVFHG